MAKKEKKPTSPESARDERRQLPPESKQAEVVTVIWTLTILATLGAELLLLFAGITIALMKIPGDRPFAMVPGVMMFIATLTGVICLVLTPMVYHFRKVAPPRLITAVAVLASLTPIVGGIASQLAK